jgi:hypothetical protein
MSAQQVVPQAGDGTHKTVSSLPRLHLLRRCLFLFGLGSLFFVLGAAVMFFDLPSSSFLRRAFVGGAAWYAKTDAPEVQAPPLTVGQVDEPDKTCDGFTLCMYGGNSRAVLINMVGTKVHEWHVPFSQIWTTPPDYLRGRIDDDSVYFNDGHIYPEGELLVVIEGPINQQNSSNGYGLAKLDKNSHVLWRCEGKYHHDVDVGEDGTIYAIKNEIMQTAPPGLEYLPTPSILDVIDVISPEGKLRKTLPLLEAVRDSPYAPLLCMLERPKLFGNVAPPAPPGVSASPFLDEQRRRDVLHTNAVKVLTRSMASKFPLFKAGQLLVSLRHLDALVVLDPDSGKIVWAARGPWRAQHDPSFLANGHLLLFDNIGSPVGSRVLEYDPKKQSFPWTYPGTRGTPFFSRIRGMCQRLPNGNTLIVNSDGGEVFEVTPSREVVWSCSCGRVELRRGRRYLPEQLHFLKGVARARP